MLKLFYPVNTVFLVFTDCHMLYTVGKHKGQIILHFFRVVLGFEKKFSLFLTQ